MEHHPQGPRIRGCGSLGYLGNPIDVGPTVTDNEDSSW